MSSVFVVASGLPGSLGMDPWLGLALGLFLVLLNGFFVAAEFALVKLRPTQLAPELRNDDRRAKLAKHMLDRLDTYLSATQLGITLASLGLGWVGEPAFVWLLEPLVTKIPGATPALVHSVSLGAAFLVITVLHIVIGEVAPKSLAIRRPKPTGLWIAIPLFLFYRATYPAIWVLNWAANRILKLFGVEPLDGKEVSHDEEELRLLLASTADARLSRQKRRILDNVFTFSRMPARKIMVPRRDVIYLSTQRSVTENIDLARKSGHTRFPLCDGDLDHILGLVHIKDIFRAVPTPTSLTEVRREILFVPETLALDRLLRRMRTERVHLAAVLDEYGGVSGIVSLENVIEELVGEIQDEFDLEMPEIVQLSGGLYSVAGSTLVEDLEQALGVEFSERDEDTVAGIVLSELGRRPVSGDLVRLGPLELRVTEVRGNHVHALEVSRTDGTAASTDSE
ncbi:MAG: HlyC/CorC family transporter [Acidobacteria bacterium]|nr:HlyC/CorC family transporter [Acidobacteriota bacterium]